MAESESTVTQKQSTEAAMAESEPVATQIHSTGAVATNDEEFYKALIGANNQSYYLNRFRQFDANGHAGTSWHWPAFFITFFWLLYRKMWLFAVLYFFVNCIAAISFPSAEAGIGLVHLIYWGAIFILPALYANALYYRHCKIKISEAQSSAADVQGQLGELTESGGTSNAALMTVLVIGTFALIGILAAMALPQYQAYQQATTAVFPAQDTAEARPDAGAIAPVEHQAAAAENDLSDEEIHATHINNYEDAKAVALQRRAMDRLACALSPAPSGDQLEIAHNGQHGTLRVFNLEGSTENGTLRDIHPSNDSYGWERRNPVCLDNTPVFLAARYVNLLKVFDLHSIELFGKRFGRKTVYLLNTETGSSADSYISDSCAFVTVTGKGVHQVVHRVECPDMVTGGKDALSDHADFSLDGDVIRYRVSNSASYADEADVAEFELADGGLKTLKPFRTTESYLKAFSNYTPGRILSELEDDGLWEPGKDNISRCTACLHAWTRSCFKFTAIDGPEARKDADAYGLLSKYCEGYELPTD